MDYQQAIDFLFPLHRFGIKPGLERIETLLDALGHPERKLGTIVHVAGTNGKGTVASCVASIFSASGRKTGLFTSPHLVDFTERIRIDGQQIGRQRVAEYCTKLQPVVLETGATFFEATTAMAFAFFADEGVDAAVIETGMGGRLDATNVVQSDVVIIPSIGMDHTEWLGGSIPEIAAEKAAIIKPGSRVFTAVPEAGEAFAPIREVAEAAGAELHQVEREAEWSVEEVCPGALALRIALDGGESRQFRAALTGSFHAPNVCLAVMAARSEGISWEHIGDGLARVGASGYRARLERIADKPAVMLDVSHNPEGMQKTVQALLEIRDHFRFLYVIIGVAADKDAAGIVHHIAPVADEIVAVELPTARTLPAEELERLCAESGAQQVSSCRTVAEALEFLDQRVEPEDMILVTGSFYLSGEVAAMERFRSPGASAGTI
ncbi:bifunctional folylpolyglutamate synthase/dihydrofolate synthase [Chlorobaculum sp. MV4-Y]|uniref:bifunctional folylpolyglutamate synthase/dihydrofolate synthase n=1 Tax=Chlorobaculum sp. MV4-Y TaxID=2976335 RepID=UPI0021AEF8F3|nr:folylpolyglutamate synthase/dihydrofolate synthase family protein [Chlorobaculum sp. MV4-Y]UWX57909.1 bifunctional folylpolyglutamate synthase/dihydrofolate synthase [Chlorobaculum sp. MV4-Y]